MPDIKATNPTTPPPVWIDMNKTGDCREAGWQREVYTPADGPPVERYVRHAVLLSGVEVSEDPDAHTVTKTYRDGHTEVQQHCTMRLPDENQQTGHDVSPLSFDNGECRQNVWNCVYTRCNIERGAHFEVSRRNGTSNPDQATIRQGVFDPKALVDASLRTPTRHWTILGYRKTHHAKMQYDGEGPLELTRPGVAKGETEKITLNLPVTLQDMFKG